jgi:membrane-associated protein
LVQEKYLVQSKDFDKHGEELLFFAGSYLYSELIVAGIVTMDKKKFMYYNVISSSVVIYLDL